MSTENIFSSKTGEKSGKKLMAAQIGCGAFACEQHGPNLKRNPDIAGIKWACDLSQENARKYADAFGAGQLSDDFEPAVTDPEVDIICIATSHEAHVPIIERAAAHGKHIFCEKPMAMTEEQADRIVKAVTDNNVKLCVDYMRRMAPAVQALKREWSAHRDAPAHQPWRYIETPREKFEEEKGSDFLVRIQDESSSYRLVHLDPVKGGGLIIGEAVHWLDLACWLYDTNRPVEIRAWGSPIMRFGIYVRFEQGNEATIVMTPNGTFDYPKEMYEIACDGALFRMEFFVENQYYGRPGPEVEIFDLQSDPCPEIGKQGGLAGYLEKHKAAFADTGNAKKEFSSLKSNHGYEEIFDGFIQAVRNEGPVPCDEIAGYRATLLGQLALESIRENRAIAVSPEKWNRYSS